MSFSGKDNDSLNNIFNEIAKIIKMEKNSIKPCKTK